MSSSLAVEWLRLQLGLLALVGGVALCLVAYEVINRRRPRP